jgi:hypothetical protein
MQFYKILTLLVASACLVLLTAIPAIAKDSAHQHNDHAAKKLSLDEGKKWQSDAPLRQGMQSINDAVIDAVPAFHQDKLTRSDAKQLAELINKQVQYLVQNCKLSPQADAVLHVIIADLLAGADELANQPLSMQGLPRIVGALQQYPKFFEQPKWRQINH